jgi:toxin-antitoxin system PIN domain toxin
MILADANLLLYAFNASASEHPKARAWLEASLSEPRPFALCWATIGAFLRLSTHRAVFPAPLSPAEALEIVGEWLERPAVVVLEPGERYWSIARNLVEESGARGALVADALLAALALEHGATLASHDADFRRFPGLALVDPVAS